MMNNKSTNVFVLATEYHFLMAMCVIEENFSDREKFDNKLVLTFWRLNDIDEQKLPDNVSAIRMDFDIEIDLVGRIKREIFNTTVANLFMINVYRPLDTLIVSMAPKGTRRHLMQEGSLFYHKLEKSVFKHRIKEIALIYLSLWKKGIFFFQPLIYGRFMESSNFIDEVWLTHPDLFVGPKLKKKFNRIKFSLSEGAFYEKVLKCFKKPEKFDVDLDGYLIYLSPIMREERFVPIEIEQVKIMLKHLGISKVFIKLHPATYEKQYLAMKEAFGDLVIRNYVPAELYIAKATNSIVVGCASTTLFYNNPSCQYFALKEFYQRIGIYAIWKNIQLPKHVKEVSDFSDIQIRK